jgi:hypothetical protein
VGAKNGNMSLREDSGREENWERKIRAWGMLFCAVKGKKCRKVVSKEGKVLLLERVRF